MFDAEVGFTSDVIKDPERFVGRVETLRQCIRALNSGTGLIAVYGKRGVGKSSLLRQIQQMALGDYSIIKKAGLFHEVPHKPRLYLTVLYSCDSTVKSGEMLLSRLCNDQDAEDGLLRLVPDDGKELVEFTRAKEVEAGADLKLVKWGAKGVETSRYARVVKDDVVQTFRNFVNSVVHEQVRKRMSRDSLLILLDEFDVIGGKDSIGSIIKSMSSAEVKFSVCGIGTDLMDLIHDHNSVSRLIEQGAVHVKPMSEDECIQIIDRAEELYENQLTFTPEVKREISVISQGYPYFTQLIGKRCVEEANLVSSNVVDDFVFLRVLEKVKDGSAFPTLESDYNRAVGGSDDRKKLLHLLAEQDNHSATGEDISRVYLKNVRSDAVDLDVSHIDQNLPRLLDPKFGPALAKIPEAQGVYEFVNPVFKLYVKLRNW